MALSREELIAELQRRGLPINPVEARAELQKRQQLSQAQQPAMQQPDIQQQQQFPTQQEEPNVVNRLTSNPITQGILGAGDEMAKMLSFGMLQPKFGEGLSYNLGRVGGGILGYALPGGALKAAAPAGSLLSTLMEAKGALGGMRSALGGGLAGAAITPENRILGAGTGAALGLGGHVVGGLLKAGSNTAKNVVRSVKDNLRKEKEVANTLYRPIKEKFGDISIYDGSDPRQYESVSKDVIKRHFSPKTEELHKVFEKNQSFNNAHTLQSEIGNQIGSFKVKAIKEGSLSSSDNEALKSLMEARNLLKADIKNSIGKMDPDSVIQYEKAAEHYLNKVVPNKELFKSLNKLGARPKVSKIIKILEDAKHYNKPLPEQTPEYLDILQKATTRQKLGQKIGLGAGLSILGGTLYKGHKMFE